MCTQVLQGRRQQPLQLSHLTALTKLQLSAAVPLLSCDELPTSLLELRLRQCLSVQPLLQLSKLETLSCRPSTVPAGQLLALTQLTSLTAVKLFYEGGYQLSGTHRYWSCERVAEHAAVWVKLPLISLGLYEGSELFEFGTFYAVRQELSVPLQQLRGLTHLTMDWPLECEALAGLGQLQQLRCLSFRWGWYHDYVSSVRSDEELAVDVDAVLRLMHSINSLPRLQELSWLCDEDEDLCLGLGGLRESLQQLGASAGPGPGRATMQELAKVFELHMEPNEL
ncbi:hypothetical protein COO60DRAFT_281564 [Scenedesmus sp. NREL 46B-D3]|nr:hypothetical protein COO60DRAFT_281564 [Scenedesmus sp. NREL 46B-D3]